MRGALESGAASYVDSNVLVLSVGSHAYGRRWSRMNVGLNVCPCVCVCLLVSVPDILVLLTLFDTRLRSAVARLYAHGRLPTLSLPSLG
jgi:hypothetical protein